MPVITEAKVRKLFKDNEIVEQGSFVLNADDKLTPAAKGYLADRHVNVINSGEKTSQKSTLSHIPNVKIIENISESAVIPYLIRLTKMYPLLLKAQKAFYHEYRLDLQERSAVILKAVQQLINHRIEDDLSFYHETFLSNAELHAIRVAKQLNPNDVTIDYTLSNGQLACYEAYVECAIVRCELELLDKGQDPFVDKVSQILKALEVVLWLMIQMDGGGV